MVATKQLIILGNGFDLANELETSYESFLNWIITEKGFSVSEIQNEYHNIEEYYRSEFLSPSEVFHNINRKNVLQKKLLPDMFKINIWYLLLIHSKLSQHANWSDVEAQMYRYLIHGRLLEIPYEYDSGVREFQKLLRVILKQVKKIKETETDKLVDFFEESLHELERDFERFLFERAGYNLLNNRENCFGEYGANKLLSYIAKMDTGEVPFNLLTFNYTDPWSERWVDQDIGHEEDVKESFLFPERFLMVHGKALKKSDNNNRLIFGIDHTRISADDICYRFTKNFRTLILNGSKPMKDKNNIYEENINIIKFYGHSLCEADYSYFQQMFDFYEIYGNNKLKLYFYFSNWFESGITDTELLQKNVAAITNLIEIYGQTLDNKDHGKNLLTRLQQTGRIVVKQIEPMDCF